MNFFPKTYLSFLVFDEAGEYWGLCELLWDYWAFYPREGLKGPAWALGQTPADAFENWKIMYERGGGKVGSVGSS